VASHHTLNSWQINLSAPSSSVRYSSVSLVTLNIVHRRKRGIIGCMRGDFESDVVQFEAVHARPNVGKVDDVLIPCQVGVREGSWIGARRDGGDVRPNMLILGELGKISNSSSGVGPLESST
jgi:hypothetical protein